MKNKPVLLLFFTFISLFLLAFSPFEKEAEESVEGRKKYAVGEMAEAENEFSKAAKRLENNAEAYYDLGNALQSQQKFEEALTAYQKSLESGNATQKLRADIFHNMGNSFAGLGKYQDAEKFYIRSLEEEPSKDTAENLEIVRRIIAQQKEQEQQQKQDQEKQDQENQEEEKKENQEQNENPDDEQKEQNQQSAEQNDENNEQNDDEQNSSGNDEDGETQDEENKSAAAEEQDDEQNGDDKAKESSVLKQFKQRKNLQISPFMLKKEQKSDNGQTW